MKGLIRMKKILSLILALAVVIASCTMIASASGNLDPDDISEYPVIIVPGYSASSLRLESGEVIWGLDWDEVLDRVLNRIIDLGMGLGALTVGNAEILASTLGEEICELFEEMRCNPDGSSVYPVERVVATAEETCSANLKVTFPNGNNRHEQDMAAEIEKYVDDDYIFNFTCDFRMGSESCATQLDELIQDVKKYTGKDKVNILAVSHGGQVTATYLALFGWKNDVDNVVMTVPAIGGAALAGDMLARNVKLDEDMLIRFIEHGQLVQDDYEWLVKAQELGFLDDVIYYLDPYLKQILGNWGSIWDFAPVEDYEKYKSEWLDPVANAELIAKSDRFHYEIQPKFKEAFRFCTEEMGMRISIVSGTGNAAVTGSQENSDAIITVKASTGATCAPFGERFADGYTQIEACGGKYKVSPSMEIDASTAYLPDNTWFVNGLFHGMTFRDGFVIDMCKDLLFDDSIKDVYSDERYPQFTETDNSSHTVLATFGNSPSGFLDGDETTLTVKNIGS